MRHRPFFPHPNHLLLPPASPPTSELAAVRRGSLEVTVLDVSRLNPLLQGDGVYCIMALGMFLIRLCPKETDGLFHLITLFPTPITTDNSPWLNVSPSESEGRVVLDIRVMRRRHQPLGIQFQQQTSSVQSFQHNSITFKVFDLKRTNN